MEFIGEMPLSLLFRGDEEIVVTVVVAVLGRSPEEFDAPPTVLKLLLRLATPDADAGIRPVSSRRRMRDLRSSSSSHTVLGAVVDTDEESSLPPDTLLSPLTLC